MSVSQILSYAMAIVQPYQGYIEAGLIVVMAGIGLKALLNVLNKN